MMILLDVGEYAIVSNKSNVKICYMSNGSGGVKDKKINRINEAISSIKILGYNKEQIITPSLPFYHNENRKVTNNDYKMIEEILNLEKPKHLFICGDSDPNKTHDKCYQILENSKYPDSIKYIWIYKSAWGKWEKNEENVIIYLNKNLLENKLLAMDMHFSQEIPVVTNNEIKILSQLLLKMQKHLIIQIELSKSLK